MEDNESLFFINTCNECGLPMKIHSFEKIRINNIIRIIVKLFCQNLEHETIIRLKYEDYQTIIDESLDNICKCTICNKYILEKSIIPYYCYTCKKIICSDCSKDKHDKEHKKIFNFNKLNNKCLIHPDDDNDIELMCLICKKNYCQQCVEIELEHLKEHNIKKIKEYLIDDSIIKNIKEIKDNNFENIKNKEILLEELKNLNILISFNDFLLKEKNKNIHLLNDYKENPDNKEINNKNEQIIDLENYINNENKKELNKLKNKEDKKEKNVQNIKNDNNEKNEKENNENKKEENKENNKETNKDIIKNTNKDINKENNKIINKEENNNKSKEDNKEVKKEKNIDDNENNNNKGNNEDNRKNNEGEENNEEKENNEGEENNEEKENNEEEENDENSRRSDNEDNKKKKKKKAKSKVKTIDNDGKEQIIKKKIKKNKNNKKDINTSEINVIYYDQNIQNEGKNGMIVVNDCCILTIDTEGSIILVNDSKNLELLLNYIKKNNPNSKLFFLVNGKIAKDAVSFIKEKKYDSLFINACIYTNKIENYSSIQKKHPDFIGKVDNNIDTIKNFIKEEFKKNKINNGKIYINSLINIYLYKNYYYKLHKEISKFYGDETENTYKQYISSIEEYITTENLNLTNEEKVNLINCFKTFSKLQNKNYEEIIICYLKEYNFSQFLNSLLMKKDLSIYLKIGYFAGNLMHSIVQYGKNEGKGIDSGYTFYKGMELNIIDLLEYLKNRDYKITFPYFFTISERKEFAEIISKRNNSESQRISKEIYSVIMEIKYLYDDGYEPCIYNLRNLCQYPDEEEFIILPFTFLTLKKITINSKNLTADLELEVIGKTEILEEKIKESKSIEYDINSNIMVPK